MKLTKQSSELLHIFQSIASASHRTTSRSSMHMLSVLCNDIREANHFVTTHIKMTSTSSHLRSARQIPKPRQFDANSFPEEVRLHIDQHIVTKICYQFSLHDRPYIIYFLLENSMYSERHYTRCAHIIAMWLYIAHKYSNDQRCAQSTTLYLYMTSLQKRLPKSNVEILNEVHVNTAFTYSCPRDAEIVIYRKEEWFKVFIHESFHSFGLDFSTMNNQAVHTCILSLFDVSSKVNAYEGYTEFWAEIINALFCGFYATREQPDALLATAINFIHLESQYSLFQLTKALHFMGLRYQDLYSTTKKAILLRKTMYKEQTNVLAYYVIKGILMAHWSSFLDWCQTHNTTWLAFKRTTVNQQAFCRFIEDHYTSRSMMAQVNQSIELLSRLQTTNKKKPFVVNTMRMTLCELG